jgi:ABC-2 type transport system ATP-binding protein
MACVMQAVGIAKWRAQHPVLTGINLDVYRGEILTILGPNGAGKSTLMAILAGILRPDAGAVRFSGEDLARMGARAYTRLGIVLQQHGLSPRLTVRETLTFFSACYNGNRAVDDLLKRFRLAGLQQRQIRRLSVGQRQRVGIALGFITDFDVILLDEPMAGLDPEGREVVWGEIHAARERGAAVVCTTHLTDEAQQQSDRILMLHAGTQVALARPDVLLARLPGQEKIELVATQDCDLEHLQTLAGVTAVHAHGRMVTLYCQNARQVMSLLLTYDGFSHLSCGAVSLADLFRLCIHSNGRMVP